MLNARENKAARPFPNSHVPKIPQGTPLDGSGKTFSPATFIKEAPKSNRRGMDPLVTYIGLVLPLQIIFFAFSSPGESQTPTALTPPKLAHLSVHLTLAN